MQSGTIIAVSCIIGQIFNVYNGAKIDTITIITGIALPVLYIIGVMLNKWVIENRAFDSLTADINKQFKMVICCSALSGHTLELAREVLKAKRDGLIKNFYLQLDILLLSFGGHRYLIKSK